MAIYDKPTKELIKEFLKAFVVPKSEGFGLIERKPIQDGGYFSRQEIISWFTKNYPKIKKGTITAHLVLLSTNARSRIHYNLKSTGTHDILFQMDSSNYRLYDRENDPQPIYENNIEQVEEVEIENEDLDENNYESKEFAYEKDLQNFLAKNLYVIEENLKLYEQDEINGIEYPAGGRFIDILAVDKNNNFVVVELKVARGYDRTIGQILRYMAWIKKELADQGQLVRGVIVASNISNDLKLASSSLSNVELFEYKLSFSLNKIDTSN
jgi:endonuclease